MNELDPRRIVFLSLAAAATLAILYASWLSNPHLAEAPLVPKALGRWADRHPNLRTAVPYCLMAMLLPLGWRLRGRAHSCLALTSG